MAWLERIKDARIETAAGDIFTFEFKDLSNSRTERTEKFSFRSDGDYISRTSSGSQTFPVKLYFSGADCDQQADAFELATRDPRPLKFYHPLRKKTLLVQLLSIERIDALATGAGEIEFTLSLHETIELEKAVKPESASKYVDNRVTTVKLLTSENFGEELATKTPGVIDKIKADIAKAQEKLGAIIEAYDVVTDEIANFQSALLAAEGLVITIESDAEAFANVAFGCVTTLNNVISFVGDRIAAIASLNESINEMTEETTKKLYRQAAISTLAQCSLASTSSDYKTRTAAFAVMDTLDADFQTMRNAVEAGELSGALEVPDMETMPVMQDIVNTTFSAFASIAYGAKQQRTITLDKAEVLYPLVYRLMGGNTMEELDTLVDGFIQANELGGSELFELKHGKSYRYYL